MLKHKAYKFRLYPNKEQAILINKTIGCSRFVYNHFLNQWNETYNETGKGLSYGTCSAQLPSLKKQEETLWLKEVVAVAKNFPSSQLCSACGYQNKAVKNLALRVWTCPECGSQHDRDINAGMNLKQEALKILSIQTVGTTGLA